MEPIAWALLGGMLTFGATALGSAFVYFFKHDINPKIHTVFLGFAAGIMTAASVWSLLIPSMEIAAEQGLPQWLPSGVGFLIGGVILYALDKLLPHQHPQSGKREGIRSKLGKQTMLVLAVTLHNIPEGFSVGIMFAAASANVTSGIISLTAAFSLAIGLCIQNVPEGAAVSLPLVAEGMNKRQAFKYGALSGIVEPIAAVCAALLVDYLTVAMPWLLSIAAGAMIYVVAEELIPESHLGEHSHAGTFAMMAGFFVMMALDSM